MNKFIVMAMAGGIVYWMFIRPKTVPSLQPQQQLTVTPNPQQMSPTVQGVANYYNVDAFPIGSFSN